MASAPSSGASGSFAGTSSVGLRTRDDDRVEAFLDFGAGFTSAAVLRFLDPREKAPAPMSNISLNSVREGPALAAADPSSVRSISLT